MAGLKDNLSCWRLALAGILVLVNVAAAIEEWTPPECKFIPDMPNEEMKVALNQRCFGILASKYINLAGQRGITIHDRRCGVVGVPENETMLLQADVCYSTKGDGVAVTYKHTLRLETEVFFPDYTDVRKKRFKRKKAELEKAFNRFYMRNWTEKAMAGPYALERVIVLSMAQLTSAEPNTTSTRGVEVKLLVQFGPGTTINLADYAAEFRLLTNVYNESSEAPQNPQIVLRGQVERFKMERGEYYNDTITDTLEFCNALSTIEKKVPVLLWNNSVTQTGIDGTTIPIGTTVEFKCPDDTQLSEDEDGFIDYDNTFSLICTSTKRYKEPYTWPDCRAPCPKELPTPDANSGLEPNPPKTRIPEGKFGTYVCKDPTLGVEQGPSEYLEVLCKDDQTYDIPPDGEWPMCRVRTTTISPAIPVAIKEMLDRKTFDLNYRVLVTQYGRDPVILDETNWMMAMTVPAIIGLAVFIFCCCCLIRNDSPIFRCCHEEEEEQEDKNDLIQSGRYGRDEA